MSQPPPIPNQPPYPPPHPPQYPPVPPGGGYGYSPQQRPAGISALAITSLICSLILCLPYISALLGLAFGVAGLFATAGGKRRGRPMAIIGIIVSILSLIVWTTLLSRGWNRVGAPMVAGISFVDRAAAGDLAGARRFATADVTDAEILQVGPSLQPLGRYRQAQANSRNANSFQFSSTQIAMQFVAYFENGTADLDLAMVKVNGEWKVSKFKVKPTAASTQPAGMIDFGDTATTVPTAP